MANTAAKLALVSQAGALAAHVVQAATTAAILEKHVHLYCTWFQYVLVMVLDIAIYIYSFSWILELLS